MSPIRVNTSKDLKKNLGQKGQISVFLALGFLVLFTMFGMTINVGMVVHDKINIQNATDFAAIYVAQRQAEMLNAIAHFNYQIRQAHKLLSYRYMVLGTAGIDNARTLNFQEVLDPYADKTKYPACVADENILTYKGGENDNWCSKDKFNTSFPGIPILNVVNPGLGGNNSLRAVTQQVAVGIMQAAGRASAVNWWFTANIMASFKNQVAYRKAMIKALARNLTRPIEAGPNGMKDLYGDSVFEGAEKTFSYNLSESSRRSGGFSVQVRNSIGGLPIEQWLPEIATFIIPVFAQFPNATTTGQVDKLQPQVYYEYPLLYLNNPTIKAEIDANIFNFVNPDEYLRDIVSLFPSPQGDDLEDILGFEKNPWHMIYAEVQAEVNSGALFSPLPNVKLQAAAFAKPFGGRIGPWFGRDWPAGSSTSSSDKVEPLWPNRRTSAAVPTRTLDPTMLPNAPKYPGDTIGYRSYLAQSSTGQLGGGGNPKINRFDINEYINITLNLFPLGDGQALSTGTMLRPKELSAIAPDLFDITYYSIESNFHENYLEGKLDNWLLDDANSLFSRGLQYQRPIWRDIGYSTAPTLQTFNVRNQLNSQSRKDFSSQVFYFLDATAEGLANVLTSWVGGTDVMDYRTPASGTVKDRFGRCGRPFTGAGGKPNIPGECLADGGRTGYSVKLVSKEYLKSNQHRMSKNSVGAILNPPTD